MTLSLYVEPVKPPEPTSLGSHPLKGLIADHFFDHDGSLVEEVILTKANIPVLDSLLRAETKRQERRFRSSGDSSRIEDGRQIVDGLTTIIKMIKEHGAARVFTHG